MPHPLARLYLALLAVTRRLRSSLCVLDLRLQGIRVGRNAQLRGRVRVTGSRRIVIGNGVRIADGVALHTSGAGRIIIGDRCSINRHSFLAAWSEVRLGSEVGIGPLVYIVDRHHRVVRGRSRLGGGGGQTSPVQICDKAGLGSSTVVLPGVTIGEGAMIGANSVVTRDVPPWTICAGVPARVLREQPTEAEGAVSGAPLLVQRNSANTLLVEEEQEADDGA